MAQEAAASNENARKRKLLALYQLLMEETDADRGLTMAEILSRLSDMGIAAERKAIYRDISALKESGIEVTTLKTAPVQYTLAKGKASLPEVMMLLDAVGSSTFLSESIARKLGTTVKGLVSKRQRELLDKRVHVEGRIKSQNDSVFHNVDKIHEAMRDRKKISFMYFKYGTDLERHARRDTPYVQTPVRLVFADGRYYLVAWSDARETFLTFRVDRMYLLQVSDEPATRNEAIRTYGYGDFEYKAFGMFDGERQVVTLHVAANGMDVLVDTFGREGLRVASATPEACDVHVKVRVSSQFYGWLAGLHGIVDLVAPSSAVEAYRSWVRGLTDVPRSDEGE